MGEVLKFKLNLNLRTFWETFDFWGYHRFSLGFQKKWQIGFIFFQSSLKKQRFFNCYRSKYRKLVYRPDKLKFILVCIFQNKAHTIVQRTLHRNLLFLIFRKKDTLITLHYKVIHIQNVSWGVFNKCRKKEVYEVQRNPHREHEFYKGGNFILREFTYVLV